MPTVFRLPDIGEGLTEAEVVEWHAAVGDEVRADQALVTVETDKAQVDLPAPVAGVLLHRGAEAGTVLPVGEVLAVIGIRGERWSGAPEPTTDDQDALPLDEPSEAPEPERPPLVGTLSEEAEDLSALPAPVRREELSEPPPTPQLEPGIARRPDIPPPGSSAASSPSARPRALPLVRREAARRGIDLAEVEGSGPGGRVLRSDLDAVGEGPLTEEILPAPEPASEEIPPVGGMGPIDREVDGRGQPEPVADEIPPAPEPASEEIPPVGGMGPTSEASGRGEPEPPSGDRLPLSATRKAIARTLTESWQTIPHVTTFGRFDATRLLAARRSLESRHDRSMPLDALLAAACLPVLAAHPELNASLDGDHLVLHHRVDLGVAIDAPGGLLVGVVRDAGSLGLLDLADRVVDLAERAKQRKLSPDELRGQTFTVSNIGAVGGGMGTPIIPLGTTGILSVGRAEATPVVHGGEIVAAPMAPLSLSYDHRVIDGATGRAVMAMLIENLEEPALFLV